MSSFPQFVPTDVANWIAYHNRISIKWILQLQHLHMFTHTVLSKKKVNTLKHQIRYMLPRFKIGHHHCQSWMIILHSLYSQFHGNVHLGLLELWFRERIRAHGVNKLLAFLVFRFNQSIYPAEWHALLRFGALSFFGTIHLQLTMFLV